MKKIIKIIIQYIEKKIQHKASYLVVILASAGIFSTLLITIIEKLIKGESANFLSEFWDNLTFLMDAAKLAEISDPFPDMLSFLVMILMTIVGIVVFSTLIAVISQIVDEKINAVRSGTSPVRSEFHTVIIGYSKKVPLLIRDASQDNQRSEFVIYSDYDEESMRLDLSDIFQSNQVLFKKGVSKRQNHGKYLNLIKAKSVLIVSEDNSLSHEQNDVTNLQIMISLIESSEWQLNPCKISVEVNDPIKYSEAIRYCKDAFPWILECTPTMLHVSGLKSDLLASLLNSPKAFHFLTSLLGFDGDDFHFLSFPEILSISKSFYGVDLFQLNRSLKNAICVGYLLDESEYLMGGLGDLAHATYLRSKNPPLKPGMTPIFLAESRSALIGELSKGFLRIVETETDLHQKLDFEKRKLESVCFLINSMRQESLTRLVMEILLQSSDLRSVKIYLKSEATGMDKKSIRQALSVEIDHLEFLATRYGFLPTRDHHRLGISALPVRVNVLESDTNSDIASLFMVTHIENKDSVLVEAGVTEGSYLVAILAAKKNSLGRETLENWDEFFSTREGKDDPRGPYFDTGLLSHSMVVSRFRRSLSLVLEASDQWDLVLIWAENLYGEIRSTLIDPQRIFDSRSGSKKLGVIQEFPKLDNIEIDIEVVDDFVQFLGKKSFYHDDVVVWANDTDADDETSIDTISERFVWNLLTSDCFHIMSTYEDFSDYMLDILDEVDDDAEEKTVKQKVDREMDLVDRKGVMFFVSNASTSERINNIKACDRLDICSFDENTFASRMISSLSNDPVYARFFDALSTGELSFELVNVSLRTPLTFRMLLENAISNNIGVPIGYRIFNSDHSEYLSLTKNIDDYVDGTLSLIVVSKSRKRHFFAPNYEL